MDPVSTSADRCVLRSLDADEPLPGTASTIRRWLLLEHKGPWGVEPLRDARLPPGLPLALQAWERRTGGRVLLIRRAGSGPAAPTPACFAVDTATAWIGSRPVARLDDVIRLDPSDRATFPDPVTAPVVVVCTHGRRDVCCAERGRPLARAAAETFPDAVWESTHVGGDRFAGNLVAFPHGLYFGRVEPERGPAVVAAYGEGRIVLDHYRGRACDPMPVQAADHAVRVHLGLDGVDEVRPAAVELLGENVVVRLGTPQGVASVTMERVLGDPIRLTCHAERAEPPSAWRVIDLTV